ncbi:MAG: hypothetical protein K940chlam2_00429 [Chlamydiae bacterium]|nr:hypothetical protein [Chlamydiota bacterium]
MLNEKSLSAVENATFSTNFKRPLYDSYCFSNIPATVERLFTGEGSALPSDCFIEDHYDSVTLLFLDGFGWSSLEKFRSNSPFLETMLQEGIASKLTSMFPSTTAAHVTCIHTGLCPGQSGIYEWFVYEPSLDRVIAPLPFSFAGDHRPDHLVGAIDIATLFPFETLYLRLKEKGIHSTVFEPRGIAGSTYSKQATRGATTLPYTSLDTGLDQLLEILKKGDRPHYATLYFPNIDSILHRKGIGSAPSDQTIRECLSTLESFLAAFKQLPGSHALIVTADHGMAPIDPKTTLFLNKEIPSIVKNLRVGRENRPLVPAGSPRDFFLHLQPDKIQETEEILTPFLKGKAEIHLAQTLMEEGFFGPVTERLRARIGDLVILPYKGESVWWYEKGHFEQNFHAAHGGLTTEEMEIPFLFFCLQK